MVLVPLLAVLLVAFGASVLLTHAHRRATPGGAAATTTGLLLDRRVQRVLGMGVLVVLTIALLVT